MAAFHPLQTLEVGDITGPMTDPFRTVALQARIIAAGALVLVAALIFAVSYLDFGTAVTDGQVVQAEVPRLGTRSASAVAGGDVPIITVRLPDGLIRDVQATWADVNGCKPGRPISLLQQKNAAQVGQPGCISAH
jgi:hypothetical protein